MAKPTPQIRALGMVLGFLTLQWLWSVDPWSVLSRVLQNGYVRDLPHTTSGIIFASSDVVDVELKGSCSDQQPSGPTPMGNTAFWASTHNIKGRALQSRALCPVNPPTSLELMNYNTESSIRAYPSNSRFPWSLPFPHLERQLSRGLEVGSHARVTPMHSV